MQTVNVLTTELQLRVEGSNIYYSWRSLFKTVFFKNQVWNLLLMAAIGQGRVAKNIKRLSELVTIFSKQKVIVPEQKFRALLS